ncbi:MAG: alpha/beta hydrolase [Candidatus Tectomicrobia bacterium RIFCSPLOWO2_12_FULL_69_37]|nr:MAG: alpha/beta hydrolase [Candidatus Tectomicrobia bacterium RIFCSPLOWO2_02_FULL_70_19]OGL66250.1 MAG: alpha/beta hydrolase [Candidatus Tectomicrobia bacterium RIFCSPLOWO2_12_FULL_69_37]
MPEVQVNGVRLYYESQGAGAPVVFVHEFAGAHESWVDQVRFFCRRYHVVTYNARGYPPSEVPPGPAQYSQDIAVDDLAGVIQGLDLAPAHVVGLSMGGYATLHLGLRYPALARSLVVAGCGYGSVPSQQERFRQEAQEAARRFEEDFAGFAATYTAGPTRLQLERKDPIAYDRFVENFRRHSPQGSANTMRGLQSRRPSVYALEEGLRKMEVPTLILTGDEDEPCLEPGLFLKRTLPRAALVTFPNAGHLINLEEPALFNRTVLDFITEVDAGRWPRRDPRTRTQAALFQDARAQDKKT